MLQDKIGIDTPALSTTTTLYVGGLSNETREEQIYLFFGTMGPVRRVIMGLDRVQKVPCGFCFVEYACLFVLVEAHRIPPGTAPAMMPSAL